MATFRGSEYFCYDLSQNPIQSSSDEITLSFKTWQRNGLILHTGKSADYVNLALKDGAVSLVINLGSGAFEAIVEPINGKFNDNSWHDVKVTRNLRQVRHKTMFCQKATEENCCKLLCMAIPLQYAHLQAECFNQPHKPAMHPNGSEFASKVLLLTRQCCLPTDRSPCAEHTSTS